MTQEPLIIERSYNAPLEKIWKAITDKEQMKEWYFELSDFKPEVGFEFTFEGENEGRVFLHLCEVIEVIPLQKLKYSWSYKGIEGMSYLTFELFPDGEATRLKLTHEGLESFPQDRDTRKENFLEGWKYITGISLSDFLEKTKIRKEIKIQAKANNVWNVLTDTTLVKQWAAAFSEGAYVESDWQKDSEVIWKDKNGNIGTKGKVTISEPHSQLAVFFYDDVNADTSTPPGTYHEKYFLAEHDGATLLQIEAGPLKFEDATSMIPSWEKALEQMKLLAER